MFNKLITLIVAIAISLSMAGSAFATFADMELIRVYYDRDGSEIATDLGNIKTLLAAAPGASIAGSFGALNMSTSYVAYFALDRTAGVSNLWASGSTATPSVITGGRTGLTGIKNGTTPMYALYNTQGGTNYTGLASETNSFASKLSASQGSMGSAITAATRPNTEANLGTVPVSQFLYYWSNGLTTVTAEKTGVAVATITTNANGSTVITPPPAPSTVPDAPTIGTATASGDGQVTVTFTQPSSDGGSHIIDYTVTSSPNGISVTDTASPITVPGLTSGTAYTFTVTARNAVGTSLLASAPSNSVTATGGAPTKSDQTIVFGAAPTVVAGGTGTITATSTSALAVTFTATPASVCTSNGATITGITAGTCTVTANQAGNDSFNAATAVTQDIIVGTAGKTNQTIAFGAAPTVMVGGTGTVIATGGASGNVVTFTAAPASVCTNSGSTITGVAAGTCTVTANQVGNDTYNAATPATQSITIAAAGPANQIITFGTAPTVVVGGTGTVTATATSALQVTFSTAPASVCTNSGATITGVAAGTCTVTASQTGNANYNAATPVTQTITIAAAGPASQTITFGTAPTVVVGGTGTVTATATSGLAVTFTTAPASVCTNNGPTITGVTSGTCTITANQTGNANYNAATPVTQTITITVGKASQTIGAITFSPAILTVGGTTTASATATSGLAVIFSSTTTSVCTVSGSLVTSVSAGTCTIAADQAGNTSFNAALQVTQAITASKRNQTIVSLTFNPGILTVNDSTTVGATSTSGLPVTFSSVTPGVCSVSVYGTDVTGLTAGSCTIAADQLGNGSYNQAPQVTQNITVGKGNQTIISFTLGSVPLTGGTTTASATGGASGSPVIFSSITPTVCSAGGNNGSTITIIPAGTCTIAANQGGNANFNAAGQISKSITAGLSGQTITFGSAPAIVVGGSGTVSASSSVTGLTTTISFASATPMICSVSGTVVTGLKVGACIITADQTGDPTHNPAPQVIQNISVGAGSQSISFGSAPIIVVGGSGTIIATASSALSGIVFTSTTLTVCTVSGSTVKGVTAGTCTITANLAGTTSYNAANQVTLNITVGNGSQTIGTITFNPATLTVNGSTTASATATSALPVTFSSTTPDICSVSGSKITAVSAGTCIIVADQAGNAAYNAASQIFKIITVGLAGQSITFGTVPSVMVSGSGTVSAAGGASGSPVTFSSTTPTICSIIGSTVTGLAAGTCTIAANQAGNTSYNAATQATQNITVKATLPGAPTISTVIAGNAQATVSFTKPASDGGSAITGYTVTSSPGGVTATGAASPITVSGLTNDTSYTFTVTATNSIGTSPASAASSSVTPATTFTVTPKVTLDTNGNANGSISGANGSSSSVAVEAGKTTNFTVTPNSGYQIATVTGSGCSVKLTSGTTYSTGAVNAICTVSAAFVKTQIKGDLNGDKNVTIADALLALEIAIGLIPATNEQIAAAPLGAANGKIDIADAVAILNFVNNPNHQW